ncbi:MAG TPA: hypothetical protein VL068_01840, partial [Microthrixaceae bacterium]|nr:hypothetical protein [Microthrixaceae bacterium]
SLASAAGVLSMTIDSVIWESEQNQKMYAEADIEQATIRPLPLVGGAELRLAIRDGSKVMKRQLQLAAH